MKNIITMSLLTILSLTVFGQNERKFVRNGNKLFMEAVQDTSKLDTVRFSNAETEYRKALNKKPANTQWDFNLADAMYKQKRFEEASAKFEELGEKLKAPEEKARAFHNLGNSELMQKKLDESIESYKKALRQNPTDMATKYNLAYAQMLKNKKDKQDKKDKQNKDKNKDKDKNKNKDNKNKDKQDKNKDKQNQQDKKNKDQQQNKDKQKQDQQQKQKPQQNKISKQDAEQLLQALQNDERAIQDKVKKAKAAQAKRTKVEKEW
ncbi:MAG: tetratricopeptide repeat protein [Draconibacterium sp.]|nr:tetratricopeptide repeat protein [Draconibacterium sp.]